ncbi:PA14 domain-containing protein [Kamptonema cortianum]|nr:PA14 domain-containing protein [Geitlerinema splendidum]MDK3158338.1 PA14 domain-containing protein [Kamptonema cortianum]
MLSLLLGAVLLSAQQTTITVDGKQVTVQPGVTLKIYDLEQPIERLYDLVPNQTPNANVVRSVINYTTPEHWEGYSKDFMAVLEGYIQILEEREYIFRVSSDDGSEFTINGKTILNDGIHAESPRDLRMTLKPGYYPFKMRYFQADGPHVLRLLWILPDGGIDLVPAEQLFTEAGVTRVVSPGKKRVIVPGGSLRPGHGLPLEDVHPSYRVITLRPESWKPQVGAMCLLPNGEVCVSTFQPNKSGDPTGVPDGKIYIVKGSKGQDRSKFVPQLISEDFYEPTALVAKGPWIYVGHRSGIDRIGDLNGDGIYEKKEKVTDAWHATNYHAFTFGLLEKDGYLYGALSVYLYTREIDQKFNYIGMNGPNPPYRGSAFKVEIATGKVEWLCGGLRTPNGLGWGPDGSIWISDNQGTWLPASKLIKLKEGSFYGHYNSRQPGVEFPDGSVGSLYAEKPETPPNLYLIQNEISNSPTNPVTIPSGEFKGQMWIGEITQGGINRVALDTVDGHVQGAIFRFTQGLEGGVNRIAVDPKSGEIFVGMIGGPAEWSWRDTTFGLQKLVPTGKSAFEMHSIQAIKGGFRVKFTRAVASNWLQNPENYLLSTWTYIPSPQYGGPKVNEQNLRVTKATPSRDGKFVDLMVDSLQEGYVVYFRINPKSTRGEPIWSSEAWYTLGKKPK